MDKHTAARVEKMGQDRYMVAREMFGYVIGLLDQVEDDGTLHVSAGHVDALRRYVERDVQLATNIDAWLSTTHVPSSARCPDCGSWIACNC